MLTWKQLGLTLLGMAAIAGVAAVVIVIVVRTQWGDVPAPTAAEQLERSSPVWRGIGRYGGEPPARGE